MKTWTVVGYWDSDQKVVVGVIEGGHQVYGGQGMGDLFDGPFGDHVEADTAEAAQQIVEAYVPDDEDEEEAP